MKSSLVALVDFDAAQGMWRVRVMDAGTCVYECWTPVGKPNREDVRMTLRHVELSRKVAA